MPIALAMRETTLTGVAAAEGELLQPMDEEAFRTFYDRTAPAVLVYLARITGDRQLADDLLQETYFRFIRAGAAHESESHRRNSLFCIATNIARDARRRQRHGGRHVPLPEPDQQDTLAVDDATASRAEGRADLERAMAHLSPAQREMLWLAYGQGSSHAEIAETVGVKTGSVKPLLFRARKKLAELLRGDPS